jgi:hypothetical protein
MKYKLIIGGIIAYILLALYSGIILYIVLKVLKCHGGTPCPGFILHNGITYVLTTVGGLVSALVISKMAITTPGTDPAIFRQMGEDSPVLVKVIIWFYLSVWTVTGLVSLVVGVMIYPDACKTLSDFGTTWLGTAVAAGWAYFGLDPKGN